MIQSSEKANRVLPARRQVLFVHFLSSAEATLVGIQNKSGTTAPTEPVIVDTKIVLVGFLLPQLPVLLFEQC
jgi:hypothetical protein